MADEPQTREGDLPDGHVVSKWTFYPTLIGAVLFVLAYLIFVITAEV